ncbi:MAG: homoserine O-acetyltransferase [Candidatus Hydrogenedentes bacterium]|nr:homoserine O-acetyltransferase [Candidatus Hydrogenedentota bacterium]
MSDSPATTTDTSDRHGRFPPDSVGLVQTRYVTLFEPPDVLTLDCGATLGPIQVAYETYGTLNEDRSNAVLICHALSGDAHAAGYHSPEDRKPGWWEIMIGPGKGIDTNRYFVICSNFLGGCKGTTGPGSINPETGRPYGLSFPVVTVADMVRVQRELIRYLGIDQLLCVIGGSLGGMQALEWVTRYPDVVRGSILIATSYATGAQQIAFDAVGRNAIQADPNFNNGDYEAGQGPRKGLAVARMMAHITYLSDESMRQKFGRKLRYSDRFGYHFDSEFDVETYLDYQGEGFVNRFDANSYLYVTKAMDYFDISAGFSSLDESLARVQGRTLVVSFTSDWLFPPYQSREIVYALARAGRDVSYCNIQSDYGHDSFLLDVPALRRLIRGFLHNLLTPREPCPVCESPCPTRQESSPDGNYIFSGRHRIDHDTIEGLIEPGSRVLDIGCGTGELLCKLIRSRQIRAVGLEVDEEAVIRCVESGISVIQADIDKGLADLPARLFDYVILSMTLQVLEFPRFALCEMLRIGQRCVVSFPNFGHWRARAAHFFLGRAPVTPILPYQWYDTPNRHVVTIKDFRDFCGQFGFRIVREIPLNETGEVRLFPNLLADEALYVLEKNGAPDNDRMPSGASATQGKC